MSQVKIKFPDQLKEVRVIKGETWVGHPDALDALENQLRREAEKKASIPQEQIEQALTKVMECLRDHDGTGSTERLKRFIWSLWNGHHYINLWDLGRVLDDENSEAVAIIFTAYMRGILSEGHLRFVLENSGEMRRWDEAEKSTPQHVPVDYPPVYGSLREHCRKLERGGGQ